MPRYDRIYSILAKRAVQQGGIDVEAFVEQAINAGLSPERVQELLLRDLEENGPIFGRFFRTLTGAAEAAVMAASRQGEVVGEAAASEQLERLRAINARAGSAIENADPGELAAIEDEIAEDVLVVWVAELKNTCHLCLPLHGKEFTMGELQEAGLHPDSIHANEGWTTPCHCHLAPKRIVDALSDTDKESVRSPLVRQSVDSKTGLKGSRRTSRSVLQKDLDRAIEARDKAVQSLEGRRTLRALGRSGSEVEAGGGITASTTRAAEEKEKG